jgi:DNA polymerase-3 subunit delta'
VADVDYLAVFGHEEIRARISRAAAHGRLPQSLLLHGPSGVGKQRLAIWAAAALACEDDAAPPCRACKSCRLAAHLVHPDIHWFFPIPRPKRASGAEQIVQKLEDGRAAALEERRASALYLDEAEGATGIYVGAVHTMRRLAQKAPAMGPVKVLVIGRAEAMVPQEASPEAANALLKLLEEPPDDTTLILTSDVPGALLPTIRSRVQAVRVPPLLSERVAEFLLAETGIPDADASRLAAMSNGSIGRALELQSEDRDALRASAIELASAVLDDRSAPRLAAAHRFRSAGARGTFSRVLGEASAIVRDLLADSAGASGAASDPEAIAALSRGGVPATARIIAALEALDEARELAGRNVNPQLIVANLGRHSGVSGGGSAAGTGG